MRRKLADMALSLAVRFIAYIGHQGAAVSVVSVVVVTAALEARVLDCRGLRVLDHVIVDDMVTHADEEVALSQEDYRVCRTCRCRPPS